MGSPLHGAPSAAFSHDELPDPELCIRLLEMTKSDVTRGSIECKLTSFPISDAPPYHAISYTWDDPSLTKIIRFNGGEMEVRQNCVYALRQARWHGGSQYHWIDSICISQARLEKNHQVAIMGYIFKRASRVLACIGSHDDYSELTTSV
jgi:hypothetical protein